MSTPEQDVNRALGRLEAQMESASVQLGQILREGAQRNVSIEEMKDDIAMLKEHANKMIIVTREFNALQQAIRDAKMQTRGVMIGIGIAGGAGGAVVATFFRQLWTWVSTLFP